MRSIFWGIINWRIKAGRRSTKTPTLEPLWRNKPLWEHRTRHLNIDGHLFIPSGPTSLTSFTPHTSPTLWRHKHQGGVIRSQHLRALKNNQEHVPLNHLHPNIFILSQQRCSGFPASHSHVNTSRNVLLFLCILCDYLCWSTTPAFLWLVEIKDKSMHNYWSFVFFLHDAKNINISPIKRVFLLQ